MEYTLLEKVKAAKELVKLFHLERITFFVVSTISTIVIIGLGVYSFTTNQITWDTFLALFLPTGGIFFSCGLILKMFSECIKFLKDELK
jgi:hypothetical protein